MKAARWLALVVLALCAAWFFAEFRDAARMPEWANESAVASQTPSGVVEEPHAAVEVTAVVPQAPEEAAPAAEAFAPPSIESAAPARAMIYGFALPIAGSAALEAPIYLNLTDSYAEEHRCEAATDGGYSFTNLASARYWIRAQMLNGGEARQVIEFDASSGDRRLDLQLAQAPEIQVEVVDGAGDPIRNLISLAVATLEPPGDWCEVIGNAPFGVGRWSQNGTAGLSLPASVLGCLRLNAPPPVFVSLLRNQRVVATQRVELGQERVRFVLDRGAQLLQQGRLRFRLIDAQTREPLPGINLMYMSGPGMGHGLTELDGRYDGAWMPGWLTLVSISGAYESPAIRVRIEAGTETDLGDIALGAAVAISGHVVDEQGRGVARRIDYLEVDPLSGVPMRTGANIAARSSADGSFRIGGLARRRYRLNVDVKDSTYARSALLVDARAGSVEGARLQLTPGIPCLISSADERWSQVVFDLFDAQGTQLLSSGLWGPEPRKILLAPGQYAIDVRTGDKSAAVRREFTIGSEAVELALP